MALTPKVTQFFRLARDCQIAGEGGATGDGGLQGRPPGHVTYRYKQHGERRLGQAAVNLAFVSVIQGRNKVKGNPNVALFLLTSCDVILPLLAAVMPRYIESTDQLL